MLLGCTPENGGVSCDFGLKPTEKMYPHKERCPVGCFCFGGNLWGFRQVERDPIPLLLCNPFPAQRAPRHGTWDIKGARKKSANVGNRTWLTRFRRDLVRKPDKSRCLDIQKVQLSNGFLFCNPKLRGRLNSNFMGSSFGSFVKYKKCTSLTSPWVRAGVPPPQTQRPLAFRGSTRESKHPAGVLWSKGVFRGAQKTSPLPGPLFGCEKKCRTRLAPFWHFYRTNDKLAGFSKKKEEKKTKGRTFENKESPKRDQARTLGQTPNLFFWSLCFSRFGSGDSFQYGSLSFLGHPQSGRCSDQVQTTSTPVSHLDFSVTQKRHGRNLVGNDLLRVGINWWGFP